MPGNNPSLVKESLWHTPQACTLIRTCMGPGSGMSRSTISKGPLGLDTCTERMYNYIILNIYGIWSTDGFHELIETFKLSRCTYANLPSRGKYFFGCRGNEPSYRASGISVEVLLNANCCCVYVFFLFSKYICTKVWMCTENLDKWF